MADVTFRRYATNIEACGLRCGARSEVASGHLRIILIETHDEFPSKHKCEANGKPRNTAPMGEADRTAALKQQLYDRCRRAGGGPDRLFTQLNLLDLDVIPGRNPAVLLEVVQALCNERLLIGVSLRDGLAWKWREKADAEKYKLCSTDEQAMVYSVIDDAGGEGVWSQTIQKRLNINDSLFKAAVKHLISKQLIVPFKNVEHPNKKMYIKASIRPSDSATGGPWYTDQNLDEAFIEELHRVILDFIKRQSSYRSTHGATKATAAGREGPKNTAAAAVTVKVDPSDVNDRAYPAASSLETPDREVLLPLPAGYKMYPTVREIARLISSTGITNNTILTEDDVQKLVDVLVFDDLIEPIRIAGKLGYRVTRVCQQTIDEWSGKPGDESTEDNDPFRSKPSPYASGFTDTPCGRCPVFDLCEDGGPVGPSNCVYFRTWLGNEF